MFRLVTCLLLASPSFAQHYASSSSPSFLPMDYNDDIYSRDLRRPPASNLIFNFEQRRIDQPPQVEIRDENLGKYMGRARTTTFAPEVLKHELSYVPEMDTMHLHRLSEMNPVSPKPYKPEQWGQVASHLPAALPPAPTFPKWMEGSDVRQERRYPTNTYQPPVPLEAPYARWNEPVAQMRNEQSYYPAQRVEFTYPVTMASVVPSTERQSPVYGDYSARHHSRGSHKFSWNDVKAPEPAVITTSVAPAHVPRNGGPPPPVPTLSPWADGFGK